MKEGLVIRGFQQDFWVFFLPSLVTLLLHVVAPGGLVGSPRTVILSASAILCLFHSPLLTKNTGGWISVSIATLAFFLLALLFGAHPMRFLDNISWSVCMVAVLFLPAIRFLGSDVESWKRVFLGRKFASRSEQCVFVNFCCTLMGAWVGAFPVLLDWNRPWQVWPIPCTVGALTGNLAGFAVSRLPVLLK